VAFDAAGAGGKDQVELAFGAGELPCRSVLMTLSGMSRVPASDFGGPNRLNRSTWWRT
jgi:hypothetical protein